MSYRKLRSVCLAVFAASAFLCACGAERTSADPAADSTEINTLQVPAEADVPISAGNFSGQWYLDGKNNDLTEIGKRFPGFGEWGAAMEISADGKISWYIGAIGGSGTFNLEDGYLKAELNKALKDAVSEPQDWTVEFYPAGDDKEMTLDMPYDDITAVWSPGNETENWKAAFEESLYEEYGVVPDYYEDLGGGVFQVYVCIDGVSVPYVTVDSATGDFHG